MAGTGNPEAAIRAIGQWHDVRLTGARERMLSEAFVLFYENGIRGVGIDLVIARAGVAKATFYRHFPSKTALIVEYIDRRHEAFLIWLRDEVAARAAAPRERLLAIFDVLADLFADPKFRGCPVMNAVCEVGHDSTEVLDQARKCKEAFRAYVAELAQAAGGTEADRIARQLTLIVDGAFATAQRDGAQRAAGDGRETVARLLVTPGAD
jgi:AcrR family transcriptional regulator